MNKKTWPLLTLSKRRNKIDTNPDYQRPAVWTKAQKQMLIDSILRDYDIPKIYLHKKEGDSYDVIDGQQRIRAIWSFFDDEFALPEDSDPVNGINVSNKKYSELDIDISTIIDTYNLDFVILETENEDEIREMFLRLQNGTTLKAQEKRNAMPGKMRNFIKELITHDFFKKVNFTNSRYTYDLIAAQMTLIALKKKICNIKDRHLNEMYEQYKDFDSHSQDAKNIYNVLNYLNKMFPDKAPELKRYNVLSLFVLISELINNYDIKEREGEIAKWFIEFETHRKEDELKPPEEQNPTLVVYHEKVSNSSDTEESILYRHRILKEDLLDKIPNLPLKDAQRLFDESQRQVIYRRGNGKCKICGKECEWNNWEADHIIPWDRGGKTEVDNGQILCPTCNARKGNQV